MHCCYFLSVPICPRPTPPPPRLEEEIKQPINQMETAEEGKQDFSVTVRPMKVPGTFSVVKGANGKPTLNLTYFMGDSDNEGEGEEEGEEEEEVEVVNFMECKIYSRKAKKCVCFIYCPVIKDNLILVDENEKRMIVRMSSVFLTGDNNEEANAHLANCMTELYADLLALHNGKKTNKKEAALKFNKIFKEVEDLKDDIISCKKRQMFTFSIGGVPIDEKFVQMAMMKPSTERRDSVDRTMRSLLKAEDNKRKKPNKSFPPLINPGGHADLVHLDTGTKEFFNYLMGL